MIKGYKLYFLESMMFFKYDVNDVKGGLELLMKQIFEGI